MTAVTWWRHADHRMHYRGLPLIRTQAYPHESIKGECSRSNMAQCDEIEVFCVKISKRTLLS